MENYCNLFILYNIATHNKGAQFIMEEFENQSFLSEFWEFLKIRKRYWLLPIIIVLSCLGLLILFTQASPVAPFVYTLF